MKTVLFFLFFCCSLLISNVNTQQCYVSAGDGDDMIGDGSSASPWNTFTPAFNANCTTIFVDLGTYDGPNNRGFSISYCVDITLWVGGPNSSNATEAVINLGGADRFVEIIGPADGSATHIDNMNYRNGDAISGGVIDITGCDLFVDDSTFRQSDSNSGPGGAIYAHSSSTIFVQLNNTVFEDNSAGSSNGGAVTIEGDMALFNQANLTTIDVDFINNNAYKGGAVFVDSRARAQFTSTTFEDNTANPASTFEGASGGAIYVQDDSLAETKDCEFFNNQVVGDGNHGGAVASDATSTQVHDASVFCNNVAEAGGGGVQAGGAVWGDSQELVQFS